MGLDQYLSTTRKIDRSQESLFYSIKDLFGEFSTKPPGAEVDFYISNWSHRDKRSAESEQFQGIVGLLDLKGFVPDSSPSGNVKFVGQYPNEYIEVSIHVGYWRKANQIHQWFVDNVQGGEDECNPFPASREKLQELVSICKQILNRTEVEAGEIHVSTRLSAEGREEIYEEGLVIAEPALAQELLPTQSGFFFGGTEYDEYYVQDLDETITQIEKALELPEEWSFVYQSSW